MLTLRAHPPQYTPPTHCKPSPLLPPRPMRNRDFPRWAHPAPLQRSEFCRAPANFYSHFYRGELSCGGESQVQCKWPSSTGDNGMRSDLFFSQCLLRSAIPVMHSVSFPMSTCLFLPSAMIYRKWAVINSPVNAE